ELADGRWRVESHVRAGNTVPLALVAGGVLNDKAIGNSTIAGTLDVDQTNIPPLLRMLRMVGLVDVADDLVSAGTVSAGVKLTGRLAAPTIDADVHALDLAGMQFTVGELRVSVSGQPATPQLSFKAEAPSAIVADQQLAGVQLAGQLNGDLLTFDTLTASQAVSPGRLS